MSWVLILTPCVNGSRPLYPAIVGGYRTEQQAIAAGRIATAADVEDPLEEFSRNFETYTVIPGAADQ